MHPTWQIMASGPVNVVSVPSAPAPTPAPPPPDAAQSARAVVISTTNSAFMASRASGGTTDGPAATPALMRACQS